VLQTLGSDESYRSSEPAFGEDQGQGLHLSHYLDILKRRFFYFILPFGLISILGLWVATLQKPNYLSEGKILVESQVIAPDLVRPIVTATASERIQLIQQRIMTRDNLLSVANKFGLFPQRQGVLDLMRESTQIQLVNADGPSRQGTSAIAFTVGFEYENPETAMRVASEFIASIVNEDARTRTSRATEAVKILSGETKELEDKLQAIQAQIVEAARRPHDSVSEMSDQDKSQSTALAALRAELIQKKSVYSDAHPAVTALKKRIAAMEQSATQATQAAAKPAQPESDSIDALKRQWEALEKQLADANGKLATARLSEKLDRDQQSERLQVIESPPLPQKPLKSNRLKMVGMVFAAAAALGMGAVVAAEFLNGSIRGRHQLAGVVASPLIVSVPYIATRADVVRTRLRIIFGVLCIVVILLAWGGLVTAILLHLPIDLSWFDKMGAALRLIGR
jgi:uncharacterized protein involved in exopolysaccharide biosynthesis